MTTTTTEHHDRPDHQRLAPFGARARGPATGDGGAGDASRDPVIPEPWLTTTFTVPAARCGPPGTANGGWVSGALAGHLGSGPAVVTLHRPTPLDVPLEVRAADDDATLSHDGRVLAHARRSPLGVRAPAPVAWDIAVGAERHFAGHHDHPFPGCFVCGTDRAPGDGLRIFPGPLADTGGRVAAVFTPGPAHAGPRGDLPRAAVWAALDCPTAWVNMAPGEVMLLGRLQVEVHGDLVAGTPYVVVAESDGRDGRKSYGRAGIYHRDGSLLAASRATWITPRAAD
jgi:hypothetical protein